LGEIKATLIVAAIWTAWHLPILIGGVTTQARTSRWGSDRWLGIGRTVQALLVAPFASHKLRPLAAKPNKADL